MQHVRNFIDSNPALFTADNEFDVNIILNAFEIPAPDFTTMAPLDAIKADRAHNNKRCQWQNRFNRVLAQRGMYLTKRYNHDLWHVKSNTGIADKIQNFSHDSLRKRARGNELRRGFAGFHNRYSASVDDTTLWGIIQGGPPSDWAGTDFVDPERT